MTNTPDHIEIVTSVQRGRRWTAAEKMRLVEATFASRSPERQVLAPFIASSCIIRSYHLAASGPASINTDSIRD